MEETGWKSVWWECVVGNRVGVCGGGQGRSVWWGTGWGVCGGGDRVGVCDGGDRLRVCSGEGKEGECVVVVVHMVQNRKQNKYELEVGTVFKVPSLGSYFCQPSPISLKIDSTVPKIAPFKTRTHGRLRRFKPLTVILQRFNSLLSETAF